MSRLPVFAVLIDVHCRTDNQNATQNRHICCHLALFVGKRTQLSTLQCDKQIVKIKLYLRISDKKSGLKSANF